MTPKEKADDLIVNFPKKEIKNVKIKVISVTKYKPKFFN